MAGETRSTMETDTNKRGNRMIGHGIRASLVESHTRMSIKAMKVLLAIALLLLVSFSAFADYAMALTGKVRSLLGGEVGCEIERLLANCRSVSLQHLADYREYDTLTQYVSQSFRRLISEEQSEQLTTSLRLQHHLPPREWLRLARVLSCAIRKLP